MLCKECLVKWKENADLKPSDRWKSMCKICYTKMTDRLLLECVCKNSLERGDDIMEEHLIKYNSRIGMFTIEDSGAFVGEYNTEKSETPEFIERRYE